jgi:hypothetical protein
MKVGAIVLGLLQPPQDAAMPLRGHGPAVAPPVDAATRNGAVPSVDAASARYVVREQQSPSVAWRM